MTPMIHIWLTYHHTSRDYLLTEVSGRVVEEVIG